MLNLALIKFGMVLSVYKLSRLCKDQTLIRYIYHEGNFSHYWTRPYVTASTLWFDTRAAAAKWFLPLSLPSSTFCQSKPYQGLLSGLSSQPFFYLYFMSASSIPLIFCFLSLYRIFLQTQGTVCTTEVAVC